MANQGKRQVKLLHFLKICPALDEIGYLSSEVVVAKPTASFQIIIQ